MVVGANGLYSKGLGALTIGLGFASIGPGPGPYRPWEIYFYYWFYP